MTWAPFQPDESLAVGNLRPEILGETLEHRENPIRKSTEIWENHGKIPWKYGKKPMELLENPMEI